MTGIYFDRKGRPIDATVFSKLFADRAYKVLAQDELKTGWLVSTVWLGIMHLGDMLFETMVFRGDLEDRLGHDVACVRYKTEEEAVRGHARMVRLWADPLRDAKYRLGAKDVR